MFRFDYRFNDSNTLYARYNIDNVYIDNPTDALGSHNVVPHVPTNAVLAFQHIFSPTVVNEAKFGVNRANYHNWSYGIAPVAISVSSASFSGLTNTSLDTEVGTTFSYIDNLTVVRGRHTLKFGANIMRVRLNNSGNTLTTQSLSYASTDDFINNKASSATYLQGEGVVGNRRTFYPGLCAGRVQGDAEPDPEPGSSLRVLLGLARDSEPLGGGGHPGLRRLLPQGHAVLRSEHQGLRAAHRPGLGACLSARQDHHPQRLRHLLRRQPERRFQRSGGKRRAALLAVLQRFPGSGLPADRIPRSQESALTAPRRSTATARTSSTTTGTSSIQQQLGHDFVGQVSYIGGQGHHLFSKYTVNLIDPATGKRPLAGFGSFGFKTNDGNNNFNTLQASLQRRFTQRPAVPDELHVVARHRRRLHRFGRSGRASRT